jgi:hypothetical protein
LLHLNWSSGAFLSPCVLSVIKQALLPSHRVSVRVAALVAIDVDHLAAAKIRANLGFKE